MKSVDFYMDEDDYKFLEKLTGNVSEHIRQALRHYIDTLRGNKVSESKSQKHE
jgi:hypothetical protein